MPDTNKASVPQRDVVLVSWKNEKHLFHRYKHLFWRSLRCSAKALVQYGFQSTILKLMSWWDMAKDRLSNLASRNTNSIMISVTENTSRSSVRTDLTTAYTYCTHPQPSYKNSNMYHTSNVLLSYSKARPWRGKTWMLEGARNEQPGS